MPKCILKNFVNKYQSFYYYDVAELKIKLSRPKSLNAQNGYYSNRIERMLQKIVESPLGDKLKYVKENDFSKPIDIPLGFKDVVMT